MHYKAMISALERFGTLDGDGWQVESVASIGALRRGAMLHATNDNGADAWIAADHIGQTTVGATFHEAHVRIGYGVVPVSDAFYGRRELEDAYYRAAAGGRGAVVPR